MNHFFKSCLSIVLLLSLTFACSSPTRRTITGLNVLLDSVYLEYVPDDRIELWDVSVHSDSGHFSLIGNLTKMEAYDVLEEKLDQQFPEVENRIILHSEDVDGAMVNALVNNSVIHLRKEPSSTKELVTQALLGTPVRILKTEGGKSLIQVPDRYIGWVNTKELSPVNEEELAVYREAEKLIFTAQYGMAFSEPDPGSMPVTDLVIGNIVSKVIEKSGYTQIKYPDGRLGWVKSSELVSAEEIFFKTTLKEDLVETALRFHGIPYLWGGTSSKTIDCSGLVCNIYFMNGIQLPRDADMQALIGRELTTDFVSDGLEAGDLLFFGRKATEEAEENVSHVAMYTGEGNYIHSAGWRERVSINSMDSTRENFIESYPEIFVRAVRILGEDYDGFKPIAENTFFKEIISTE
ncbi:MAG: NlpC/P60 family protein [Bacteroidota bacterium]|nr:NlpC/P60 family protein [Bacteroidota bacterium]